MKSKKSLHTELGEQTSYNAKLVWLIGAILLITVVLVLSGCKSENGATKNGVPVITVWHPWGGQQKERLAAVVEEFNRTHSNMQVRAVFSPTDLDTNQKFFTAVAAKKPPDATFVDGTQTAAWAEQGALMPLDEFIEKSGIKPDDFFPPCWLQNHYRGKTWALTYCADPNFAFAWNKKVFRDCGLDPEKPPQTIEELDKYNDIIAKEANGRISRIGIIPWAQFGSANATFTWGWAFGGDFYDDQTNKITCNDPNVLKAVEWMISYARKYDIKRVNTFTAGFGSRDQNPFYTGRLAMVFLHISQMDDIRQYAPNLDYGLSFIPAPPDGEAMSSWVGGWCMGIPKGSRNPELAWEFIKWCCRDPEGTSKVGEIQGLLPGYKYSPYLDKVRNIQGYDQFVKILEECKHQRPVMPAQTFYMGALDRAIDYALYGTKDVKTAMDDAALETQTELNLRIAGR